MRSFEKMRTVLRWLRKVIFGVCAFFFALLTKITKYVYVAELISLLPFRFGEQVRYAFYKRTLAACGDNVTINFGTVLSYPDITIGNDVWLGAYNIIGHADIRDCVLTAQGCHIVSGSHGHPFERTDIPIIHQQGGQGRVMLGPDIWLGANVTVLANVGQGCVVGAGSVVVKDIPDWAVAVGNPARVLRYRKE